MELEFGVLELTVTSAGDVLRLKQEESGIVEVFLNGESQGTIALSAPE